MPLHVKLAYAKIGKANICDPNPPLALDGFCGLVILPWFLPQRFKVG